MVSEGRRISEGVHGHANARITLEVHAQLLVFQWFALQGVWQISARLAEHVWLQANLGTDAWHIDQHTLKRSEEPCPACIQQGMTTGAYSRLAQASLGDQR